MHLLPRQAFDGLRVRLQCLDTLIQLLVFALKLLDLLAETLNFLLFLAQSQETVWPKYLMNEQGDANQHKDVPGVTA